MLTACVLLLPIYSVSAASMATYFAPAEQTQSVSDDVELTHDLWQSLLDDYLIKDGSGVNRFDYSGVSPADKSKLETYLDELQGVVVTRLPRDEQMAYWINLYNALTIKVILDHYPVASIRDISYGLLDWGPWPEELVIVEGYELSLNNIEHDILRPLFTDNRIHYAVNCASIGCPNLQMSVFRGPNLDQMLDQAAVEFINHPRAVSVRDKSLTLSSIYEWYYTDFARTDSDLIAHLRQYARPALLQKLESDLRIVDYVYDWSLNLPDAD